MKRTLELLFATMALLVFLPAGLLIALILRLTGERKVFYVQHRLGHELRVFPMIKFSSMRSDAVHGTGQLTVRNDPRVFPFGRFLRKTKLNEVPQLINVLRGDMGLVGPRPILPREQAYLPDDINRRAFAVLPGVTGIASIVFRDEEDVLTASPKGTEACYREDIAPIKGDLDVWYAEHRTLRLDLQLLFWTGWVILRPRSTGYRKLLGDRWSEFAQRLHQLYASVGLSSPYAPRESHSESPL